MPYFGVPIRNGLPIGLGTLTALAQAVAVVVPPVSSDPYFEYVSLLANTTSTNGAQNNTFLDSSTNAFSVTRNGNTTQGTFSPFSQTGWSNYFDGTGDYLTAPAGSAFAYGTGDFTVEGWFNCSSLPSYFANVFAQTVTGTNYFTCILGDGNLSPARKVGFIFATSGSGTTVTSGATQFEFNTWNHFAVVRSAGSVTCYLNGVGGTPVSCTQDFTNTTYVPTIGRYTHTEGFNFTGYLANLRVVKGTAVYTANFTPPTAPLTAITNTSLLTCQSNRFIDNSSNAFAITRNGDVSVQAFSPFNPTAAWSAGTNGGSGYFDGTGDYLTAPNNAAFAFGTGAFTIECWVNFGNLLNKGVFHIAASYLPGNISGLAVSYDSAAGATPWTVYHGSNTASLVGTTISSNTWCHIALVRSSNTLTFYINGTGYVVNASDTTNYTVNYLTFGGYYNTSFLMNGYISDARIVKGTAVYTANFTPPTAPLTAIANTSLLLNFTNAGIYDSASGNDLETVGNAQVSTTQAKWGTTSMAFDGTGDWLTALDRPALRFGTAPFTIEGWIYYTGASTRSLLGKGTSTTGWDVSIDTAGDLIFSYAASSISGGVVAVSSATWTHFAIVRTGTGTNQTNIYIDGQLTNQGTVATNFSGTDVLYIGASRTATQPLTGYIDDLRITNGYARYTANFTPPTAAFPLN